jgi:hypothetical protein
MQHYSGKALPERACKSFVSGGCFPRVQQNIYSVAFEIPRETKELRDGGGGLSSGVNPPEGVGKIPVTEAPGDRLAAKFSRPQNS